MGCYGRFIVPAAAIVTSQCDSRYCFTEHARTWAKYLSTPWQREFTAITGCKSIDNLQDFSAICCTFLFNNSITVITVMDCPNGRSMTAARALMDYPFSLQQHADRPRKMLYTTAWTKRNSSGDTKTFFVLMPMSLPFCDFLFLCYKVVCWK